jgi:hypothetical protein
MKILRKDGTTQDVTADKREIDDKGNLNLYVYERIDGYRNPLVKELVATFAAGTWSKVTYEFQPSSETLRMGLEKNE